MHGSFVLWDGRHMYSHDINLTFVFPPFRIPLASLLSTDILCTRLEYFQLPALILITDHSFSNALLDSFCFAPLSLLVASFLLPPSPLLYPKMLVRLCGDKRLLYWSSNMEESCV